MNTHKFWLSCRLIAHRRPSARFIVFDMLLFGFSDPCFPCNVMVGVAWWLNIWIGMLPVEEAELGVDQLQAMLLRALVGGREQKLKHLDIAASIS